VTNLTTSLEQALEISPGWRRSHRMRLRHRIQRRLERGQTERSDLLLASSHAILDWSRQLWDIGDVPSAVLPNGVDVGRVRAAAGGPPPDGFPAGEGPVVAFSGRLESRKGVQVLIPAMRRVWEELPAARLVLMGRDGDWHGSPMSAHLVELAGPDAERMCILGLQPPERLYPALRAADVVALPSLWENFALAAVETLVLGKPLVATTGSGYEDFITDGESGLLVAPGDPDALADALLRVLRDAELRERLAAGAVNRGEDLSAEAMARRFAGHLASVGRR
jgi:glycogen(starch) synthase